MMSEQIIIEPSLLSADFANLGAAAREAEAAGVKAIQIDVMDGQFVPNLCFGPGIVAALRPLVKLKLDIHLMIDEPERYLEEFAKAGADRLIVHQEACTHLHRTLLKIADLGLEVGVTINKIRRLKEILRQRGRNIPIGVDGGVNAKTAPLAVEAGATMLVAGSSAYNSKLPLAQNLEILDQEIARVNSVMQPANSYA